MFHLLGHWRVLDADYKEHVVVRILSLLEEKDWSYEAIPAKECCDILEELEPRYKRQQSILLWSSRVIAPFLPKTVSNEACHGLCLICFSFPILIFSAVKKMMISIQMDHRWKWNYFLTFIFLFFQKYSWALSQLLWWNNRHGFRHRLIILLPHSFNYCLKKEQECNFYQVFKLEAKARIFTPDNIRLWIF